MGADELRLRAATRGGVFTTNDVTVVGFSHARRVTLLSSGEWVTLRRGVYAEACIVGSCRRDARAWHALNVAAAVAASRSSTYAVGQSAACVLELDMLGRPPAVVSLVRPREAALSRGGRRSAARVLSAGLPHGDRLSHGGVLTTAVPRTVVDLSRCLPKRDAVVLADSAMRRYGVTPAALKAVLARQRDWPGAVAALRVLDLADPRSESVLESLGRLTCVEQGLPRPLSQVWLGDDRPEIRVDFYFPEFRTVGEADGRVKYTTPQALWEEKKRQDCLGDMGFQVVRFDYRDATGDGRELGNRIRRAFGRATSGPGRVFDDPHWWTVSRMAGWSDAGAGPAWWLRGG